VVGILWVLVMKSLGRNLYEYLQSVQGYMSPAIAVLFVLGIFWKRATATAAFWAFLVGAFGGFFRLALDLLISRPVNDLGALLKTHAITAAEHADKLAAIQEKWGILFTLQDFHYLYFAEGLLVLTLLLVFVISALTKAPAPETVRYTYYGATAQEKAATRASWNGWDVFHSAVIVVIVVAFYIVFW
jgi:SSS family solute:Na+ symporter